MEPTGPRFEKIGKYRIVSKIGQGAMGEVYKAEDPVLTRQVAIKTMTAAVSSDPDLRKRFLREAQSAARLNHPNIITVYDFGEEGEHIYMAMELLEGTDLKQLISGGKLRTLDQKLDVMEQIGEGLAFAHGKEVIHRDLKPANIHVQPNGQVKIMDFGLARLGASEMTAAGTVMGTPNYMSPEQVKGERADARSDIFSVGAVFYEILSGRKPFDGDSLHAILYKVLEATAVPLREAAPDLPTVVTQVVDRAMAKEPAARYQNGAELLEAVRFARRSLAIGEDPTVLGTPAVLSDPTLARPGSVAIRRGAGTSTLSPQSRSVARGGSASLRSASRSSVKPPAPAPRATEPEPPEPPPSRGAGPWIAAAAVVLLALGIVGWLVLRPKPAPAPVPAAGGGQERLDALRQALLASQIELARKSLDDKQYDDAIRQADQALAIDKASVEAASVKDRAKAALVELDAAAAEARTAFAAGDTQRSARALTRVLALDPRHPVATELMAKLNSVFRGEAAQARAAMAASRTSAERAKAGPAGPFAEGARLAEEANALVAKNEFAAATGKYLESRDVFDRARREAEAKAAAAARPSAAPPPTQVVANTLPPMPPPTMAPVTAPSTTLPAPPPITTAPEVTDDQAIRKVIADYGHAIESHDLALFRAVKPNLSATEEKALREAFKAVKSQQVHITVGPVQVAGSQARVQLSRSDTVNGKAVAFQQSMVLVKGPGGWTIRDIGQ